MIYTRFNINSIRTKDCESVLQWNCEQVYGREPNELGLAPAMDDQRMYRSVLYLQRRWIELVVPSGFKDCGYLERH